jgi:hypothetical protein
MNAEYMGSKMIERVGFVQAPASRLTPPASVGCPTVPASPVGEPLAVTAEVPLEAPAPAPPFAVPVEFPLLESPVDPPQAVRESPRPIPAENAAIGRHINAMS